MARGQRPGQRPAQRLKLVVRRLPPTLPEETFWNVVQPYVEGKSAWKRYVAGRPGDAYGQHPVHSRAYVLMNDIDSLVAFHSGFDGHIFRSKAGAEFQAVVEYAPIEKTPYKSKPKKDAREGTIDNDYLSFLESRGVVVPKPALEPAPPAAQPTSTPLLDALRANASKSKAKAAKKKEKEKAKKEGKAAQEGAGAKAAALASISDAANKRAPKAAAGARAAGGAGAAPGVVMVAGKGREVFVAPLEEGSSRDSKHDGKEKKKKPKPPKKKKPKNGEGVTAADGAAGAAVAGPSKTNEASSSKPRGKQGGPKTAKGKAAQAESAKGKAPAGAAADSGLTPEQTAGRARGAELMTTAGDTTDGHDPSHQQHQGTAPKPPKQPGRGRGGGRGRGRGGSAPPPSEARIDM